MPFLSIVVTDKSSRLSVILDLYPTQWLLSAQRHPSNTHPLSFDTSLAHIFLFLNSHIVCKHETLSRHSERCQEKGQHISPFPFLFLKLKSSSVFFYSSEEAGDPSTAEVVQPDSNSYRVFKTANQSLVQRISREFDILGQPDTEGTSHTVYLVNEC